MESQTKKQKILKKASSLQILNVTQILESISIILHHSLMTCTNSSSKGEWKVLHKSNVGDVSHRALGGIMNGRSVRIEVKGRL